MLKSIEYALIELVSASFLESLLIMYGAATIFIVISVMGGADVIIVSISYYTIATGLLVTGIRLKRKQASKRR
jgi:hypothetical protein